MHIHIQIHMRRGVPRISLLNIIPAETRRLGPSGRSPAHRAWEFGPLNIKIPLESSLPKSPSAGRARRRPRPRTPKP